MVDLDLSFLGHSRAREFDDPFLLPSSETMPDRLDTALDFALFLYYLNPLYRAASSRVRRHFITDFDFSENDHSPQEKEELRDFLHYQIQLPSFLGEVGDEEACYGNAFVRLHLPFDRFLVDKANSREYSLELFGKRAKYNYKDLTYTVPDPSKAGKFITLPFRDRKSTDIKRIRLLKINPRFITIRHFPHSGFNRYIYRFPNDVVADVKKGILHVVNDLPLKMLKAVSKTDDFIFDDDSIFHFKAPTVSGVSNYGWGIPGTIASYRDIHQIQVYRKIDEAVGLDYMLPFRLFSPPDNVSPNEMVTNLIMSKWTDQIGAVIRNRRHDKFATHSLPFPVQYQEFGAEGKNLAPKDMLEYQNNALLDGMGYPRELMSGTLQYLTLPTGLRLFENTFSFVHYGYCGLTNWVVDRVRSYLNQPKITVRMQRPALADSLERKQLMFQLVAMGELSRETGYDSLGVHDVKGEFKKRVSEDADLQRQKIKAEQDFKREVDTGSLGAASAEAQAAGGSTPGGPTTGGGGTTPMDVSQQADELAMFWMSIPSQGERAKAMSAVKNQNENLYALAKEKMEQIRRDGASQGRAAANSQAQGQGGPPQ